MLIDTWTATQNFREVFEDLSPTEINRMSFAEWAARTNRPAPAESAIAALDESCVPHLPHKFLMGRLRPFRRRRARPRASTQTQTLISLHGALSASAGARTKGSSTAWARVPTRTPPASAGMPGTVHCRAGT
jgi:hypothetical protein